MVKKPHRDYSILLAAFSMLLAGVLTLESGRAGQFEVVEITGPQARLFAWASIVLAAYLFYAFLRRSHWS